MTALYARFAHGGDSSRSLFVVGPTNFLLNIFWISAIILVEGTKPNARWFAR